MRDPRGVLGRSIGLAIVAGFVILGVVVVRRVVRHPQTDDAVVTADIIGIVPQVSGTITELHVKDNQRVKRGDLLVVIDPRPYEFALQRARADVAALDGEIAVTERRIEGQRFAVAAARATVQRMEAQLKDATDSLNRLQPLLSGEVVTPDKIDQARSAKLAAAAGYRFRGRVQGIGWAVNPEDQPISAGVPQIKRELNWVHIAQRFPVRIRVENPDPPDVFRVGASAVAIIRGWPADGAPGTPD